MYSKVIRKSNKSVRGHGKLVNISLNYIFSAVCLIFHKVYSFLKNTEVRNVLN